MESFKSSVTEKTGNPQVSGSGNSDSGGSGEAISSSSSSSMSPPSHPPPSASSTASASPSSASVQQQQQQPRARASSRHHVNTSSSSGNNNNGSFNRRPPSDTPVISPYQQSPKDSLSNTASSTHSSGRTTPRSLSNTNIPPLSLPQKRATTLDVPGLTRSKVSPDGKIAARDVESKLVIVMVGLPARGKSYVTKKLCRYLNWQQHGAKIFNVGNTRRNATQSVGPASGPLPDSPSSDNLRQDALEKQALKDELNGAPPHDQHHQEEQETATTTSSTGTSHGADFFSPDNKETSKLREKWAMDTLDQLLDYVLLENGSVGILDATNTTIARRKKVLARIRERTNGRLKVLFLESICTKSEIIDANIRLKLSGPDYKDMDRETAIKDFVGRMRNYEKAYETITETEEDEDDEDFQYIKMIDVGRKVVCYNIQGFLSGQAVFFLLNFNLAERQIWITRHGESEDNATGRIGGDAPLTQRGKNFAAALARFMDYQKSEFRRKQLESFSEHVRILQKQGSEPSTPLNEPEEPHFCVWTSMLQRTIQTAQEFDEDLFDIKEMRMLNELGAGICDGMTYSEINEKYPQEYAARIADKIRYRYPGLGGESYLDVINRLRPVIVEMERMQDNAVIIAHRVVCRVLLAYFMNLGRDAIGDLDVPLHTLYVLEPKPYGVDWAVYEYNEETDWFYKVPRETIKEQINTLQTQHARDRSNSKPPQVGTGTALGSMKDRHFSVVATQNEIREELSKLDLGSQGGGSSSSRGPSSRNPLQPLTSASSRR